MKITPKQYAKSLIEVLEVVPRGKHGEILDNFARVLENNNDLGIFSVIAEEIDKLSEAKSGWREAKITTAIEISDGIKKSIAEKLGNILNAKVKLSHSVKPDILGGMIIEFDDEIFDKSVRTWMNRFKKSLGD